MDFFSNAALIDTSAVVALHNSRDQYHQEAKAFFESSKDQYLWVVLNVTKQESYTNMRYSLSYAIAIEVYNFLSNSKILQVPFDTEDEKNTVELLKKYKNEKISFHDALCATIMKKLGIYKVFSFDQDFTYIGFEIIPMYLSY